MGSCSRFRCSAALHGHKQLEDWMELPETRDPGGQRYEWESSLLLHSSLLHIDHYEMSWRGWGVYRVSEIQASCDWCYLLEDLQEFSRYWYAETLHKEQILFLNVQWHYSLESANPPPQRNNCPPKSSQAATSFRSSEPSNHPNRNLWDSKPNWLYIPQWLGLLRPLSPISPLDRTKEVLTH